MFVQHILSMRRCFLGDKHTVQTNFSTYVRTTKSISLFGRFDLVVNYLVPFSTVENRIFKTHVKLKVFRYLHLPGT